MPMVMSTIDLAWTKYPSTCRPATAQRFFLPSIIFTSTSWKAAKSAREPAMSGRKNGSIFWITEIDWTVVYPTAGVAVGRIIAEDWAIAACRAYNNWLHEKFTNVSSRIKGMALIPIQDTEAACAELRRAVKELGMAGAMLPSNGEGIKGHF